MILYENSIENFKKAMKSRDFITFITNEYYARTSRKVSPIDKGIWKYTLEILKQLFDNAKISPNCGVRFDYVMLDTNNRFEVIIAGENNDEPIVYIVEVLPWEKVRATDAIDLVSYDSDERNDIVCVHPSYQSVSYKKYFSKFQENISVFSCVYLFECTKDAESVQIIEKYDELTQEAPVFFAEESVLLSEKLSVFKESVNGIEVLNLFHERDQLSSKGIDVFLTGILSDDELMVLSEEQKLVLASVIKRCNDKKPSLLEVNGAPGTGKTMLAISCMVELAKRKKKVAYVTSMRVQCDMLRQKINERTDEDFDIELVPRFRNHQLKSPQTYDVIFVDEAQIIISEEESNPVASSTLDLILKSSTIVVCFKDETQIIEGKLMRGTGLAEIAKIYEKEFVKYNLNRNMRYSGKRSGINWLAHQFQVADTGNYEDWDNDSFGIEIVDTPQKLIERIKQASSNGNPSRVLVRYRKRSELKYDETLNESYYEIPEYGFKIPVCTISSWNVRDWYKNEKYIGYAAGPQVTQGLEFNYVGVIIGKELSYDKDRGEVIINSTQSLNKVPDEIGIIKMAYYVLLSRGMNGVVLFFEDSALKEVIKERLGYASRRFSWIKELAEKYQPGFEKELISKQNYKYTHSYVMHIYEAVNEFVAKLKQFSEDQLDSDVYKEISDQCSDLLIRLQSDPLNQAEVQEKYRKIIIQNMGESAWNKLSDIGKKCLISSEMTYHDMKDYNQLYDFSAVCVQVSKAVEYELTNRFFEKYVVFLENIHEKDKYPELFLSNIPAVLKRKGNNRSERLLREQDVTLGSIPFIVGINMEGKIIDQDAHDSFMQYAQGVLLNENLDVMSTLSKHIKFIIRIKNDYRNKAAHKNPMDVVSAKACLDYVIEVQRTLGQMLDDYRQ